MQPTTRLTGIFLAAGLIAMLQACSTTPKAPNVKANIQASLDQSGLKDVSVAQDRDKGVITLNGHVPSDADKYHAESIARSFASGQVVANQIAVWPAGETSAAKTINSDLDKGIEKNLDAALLQASLHDDVKYDVTNGVVTLTGEVNSEEKRSAAQMTASRVPNVQQVVNKLEVSNQRATSTR
jgi:hyperosmotically inducible protein